MRGEIEDWNNGWFGVSLGLSIAEIDRLIELLTNIRNDPEQHFHISSNYAGSGGLGDIEISVAEAGSINNMSVSGLALAPGDDIPSTRV
jgi:hypothetical protein